VCDPHSVGLPIVCCTIALILVSVVCALPPGLIVIESESESESYKQRARENLENDVS